MKPYSYLICLAILLSILPLTGSCSQGNPDRSDCGDLSYSPSVVREVLDRQQKAAFTYFYDGAEPISGMALEGSDREISVTTGGSGFGVMALVVGVERGWISRGQGVSRLKKILDYLEKADRYNGAWSHWLAPDGRYVAFGDQEATGDLVETSFLIEGLLVAQEYFDKDSEEEATLRNRIEKLYSEVDWAAYTGPEKDGLHWLWYSKEDRYSFKVSGWNEGLVTYLLALGADSAHSITPEIYRKGWNTASHPDRKTFGYPLPLGDDAYGGPLFFSHYSFLGFDPRHMQDSTAWYWRQNQSHTMINRHYCIHEAPDTNCYGPSMWGLTACYGAGNTLFYSAWCPGNDFGVIAPTAALSSFPYTPFYSAQVLLELDKIEACKGKYGFADSYRPCEEAANAKHLAIDQGPIVVMMENYRSGLIWKLFMRNRHVVKALDLAGISEPELSEGFPFLCADSSTGIFDLMAHPDREMYELDIYSSVAGKVELELKPCSRPGKTISHSFRDVQEGLGTISFDDGGIVRGEIYTITARFPSGASFSLETILH